MTDPHPRRRRKLLSLFGLGKNEPTPAEAPQSDSQSSFGLPWASPNDAAVHILTTARAYIGADSDSGQLLAEQEMSRAAGLLVPVEHAAPHVLLILAEQASDLVIVANKKSGTQPLSSMDADDMFGDPLADDVVRRVCASKVAMASGTYLEMSAAAEALTKVGEDMEADPPGCADAAVAIAVWLALNMPHILGSSVWE